MRPRSADSFRKDLPQCLVSDSEHKKLAKPLGMDAVQRSQSRKGRQGTQRGKVIGGRSKKLLLQKRGMGGPPVSYIDSCIFHQSGLVVPTP
jgi:hypothetical protein